MPWAERHDRSRAARRAPRYGLPFALYPTRWVHWLVILFIALAASAVAGWWSPTTLDQTLQKLADGPGVRESFERWAKGRGEAMFLIFGFMLLGPVAGAAALLVLLFLQSVLVGLFNPIEQAYNLPDGLAKLTASVLVLAGLYLTRELWSPSLFWVLGLAARAYLAV
jgi:hypothetical protein